MKHWRIETTDNDFVDLIIDKQDAAQNALSSEVVAELDEAINELETLRPRGVILKSGKDKSFIVGADITEFTEIENEAQALAMTQRAHGIFSRLENLNIPTVAMINGHCLGGGLELALVCKYRVMIDDASARIGLPEVMLGIHPGFGGTARLIEKIGAPTAMDLMLSGRTVRPQQARSFGIVDMVAPMRLLVRAANRMLEKSPARRLAPKWNKVFDLGVSRSAMTRVMRKKVAAKASPEHYPAPYALIDLWERHGGNKNRMLAEEAKSISKLITTDTAKNLVRVFFLQENLKSLGKDRGKDSNREEKFEHVHVIGGGVMGGDIAAWCALQGLRVTIQDRNPDALARATDRAHRLFQRKLRDRRRVMTTMDRLQPDLSGSGAARADVLIEAIFENAEAKQGLFKDVEPHMKADAILATNTSSIPLETLSNVLQRPDRLIGLHFFNPVAKMQLVEIVAGENTSQQQARRGAVFARQIGRLPVPVKSSPGFLVNRILTPYMMEAVELFREGVPAPVIDKAAKKFGMPMGPIELADTVGLDIATHVAKNLSESFGGSVPAELQQKLDAGDLGKKTGRGFYVWKKGKPEKPDIAKDYRTPADITDRMVLRFVNESVACLREGVVADEDLLDAGIIFGTGFAPFRGGPMHYVKQAGKDKLHERLKALADKYGERFTPDDGWINSGNSE